MSGDIECASCDTCGKISYVQRKYYFYNIKCECCNGAIGDHFEIVKHCNDCEPVPPKRISVVIKPLDI